MFESSAAGVHPLIQGLEVVLLEVLQALWACSRPVPSLVPFSKPAVYQQQQQLGSDCCCGTAFCVAALSATLFPALAKLAPLKV